MIGTGYSANVNSHDAGREIATQALHGLAGEAPGWAVAFATLQQDPEALLAGLRSVLGDIPVLGGAGFGVYTREGQGYAGKQCGIAVFGADTVPAQVFTEAFEEGTRATGLRLGRRIAAAAQPGDTILLFYDWVRCAEPFENYGASELLDGLYAAIEPGSISIFGGATIGDFKFTASFIFDGDAVTRGGVVAALISKDVWRPIHRVTHGCTPVSTYLEVTAQDGHTVLELDGKPALDVLIDVAGIDEASTPMPSVMDLWLTLGVNHGDLWGPFDEGDYVNYLIRSSDIARRTFTLTEAAPPVGTRVRVMARDHRTMIARGAECAQALKDALPAQPIFTLLTNCAGRVTPFAGSKDGEGIFHTQLLPEGPFLGFFCACELGPFNGITRSMNWTEVLTCFVPAS